MKVLQINTVYPNGSTGKIAKGIKELCDKNEIECKIAYRYREKNTSIEDTYTVSSWLDCHIHNRLSRITMLQGCFSYFKTLSFLKKIKNYSPDILHLHNIHGSYINHGLLFKFIKKHNINTVWTLHDCWALSGGCPYCDIVECNKWQKLCEECPQRRKQILDTSKFMHKKKKRWFSGVANMHFAANSKWTASQMKKSFLKDYPVSVIYNGIDLNVFKPTPSDFRKKYGLEGKKILLGVSFGWNETKGIDVFVELSKRLQEDYKIVVVGTNDTVDAILPEGIVSIHRTNNQKELAEIYSAADLFVNPTRQEAFGLVNIEALACGTPVITFNTGGSPECIDETCGIVVEKNDIEGLLNNIIEICEKKPFSEERCIARARKFEKKSKFQEYINLYREMVEE